jgi:hypothetical protein
VSSASNVWKSISCLMPSSRPKRRNLIDMCLCGIWAGRWVGIILYPSMHIQYT